MRKIIVIIIFFLISSIVLTLLYSKKTVSKNVSKQKVIPTVQYKPWETESVLLPLQTNTNYDVLIMGSSHGRIFSRNKNHQITEEILNKQVATIAAGSSCIIPAQVYLSTFYDMKNTAKTILYFIDPWCFYTAKYNESYTFEIEPYNEILLKNMIAADISETTIQQYKAKKTTSNLPEVTVTVEPNMALLNEIDPTVINARILDLYENNVPEFINEVYANRMTQIIELSKKNNSQLVFILPATLYNDPQQNNILNLLAEYQEMYNIDFIDMSESIDDISLFYDHDHLNSKGIRVFLNKLLDELDERNINL